MFKLKKPLKLQNSACFIISLLILIHSCTSRKSQDTTSKENNAQEEAPSAESLAKAYCGTCHLYPPPELLDKKSWKNGVLPNMGYRFGIYNGYNRDSLIESGRAGKIVNDAGVFPTKQTISDETWNLIKQFYLEHAPDSIANPPKDKVKKSLANFQTIRPDLKLERPLVTQIKYNSVSNKFYLSDSKPGYTTLNILNSRYRIVTTLGLPNPVSHVEYKKDTLWILMMGDIVPSDEPSGSLIKTVQDAAGNFQGYKKVLSDLRRPVDVAYADLDGDGDEDIAVCEFGNHTGTISWFQNMGSGKYNKNVLNEKPGAIKVMVHDLNNDSRSDILVLMAQGDEGLDVYYNQGDGQFTKDRILRFPATYGSMSFALSDFNYDGHPDIVYVNGDNGDFSVILKPYHGIRIFSNDGSNHFEESFFYRMHGAYKAIPYDFDGDHDIDIAAISFFPDFFNHPEEGFIFLENIKSENGFRFAASTFPGSEEGRWITMDIADTNGDGNQDLLLGSFTGMDISGDTSGTIIGKIIQRSPAFVILKNTSGNKSSH